MRHRRLGGALLGFALFLILSGGMLAVAGVALGGRTSLYYGNYNETMESETAVAAYTETSAFQKIEVDVALGDVYLQSADSYGVELTWDDERMKLNYEVVDGKLRVWNEDGNVSGLSPHDYEVTAIIYFPYDAQFEDVNVKNALGSLTLEDFVAKNLTVYSDLGDTNLSSVTAGTANLHLSLGSLEGYGLSVGGTATVENSLGDVYLTGDFRDLNVTCDMGAVTVGTEAEKSEYSYDLKTSMGNVTLDGEKSRDSAKGGSGPYTLKVDNSMGDVDIMFGSY